MKGTSRAGAGDAEKVVPKGRGPGDAYDQTDGRESGDLREPEGVDAREGRTDREKLDDLIARAIIGEAVKDAELASAAVACGLSLEDARNAVAAGLARRARERSRESVRSIADKESRAAGIERDADARAKEMEENASRIRADARVASAAASIGLRPDRESMRERERELVEAARALAVAHEGSRRRIADVGRHLRSIEQEIDAELRAVRSELALLRNHMVGAGVETIERQSMREADAEAEKMFNAQRDAEIHPDRSEYVEVVPGLVHHDPAEAARRRAMAQASST